MDEYHTLTIVLNFISRPTVVEGSDMILAGSTGPEEEEKIKKLRIKPRKGKEENNDERQTNSEMGQRTISLV
jgi:hypothetical protein